ncbi:helix-turn-helix transcriptional regulator [Streptomyces hygroscopicus]|uniref:helix-turn-helix transcriptional regulator n=1 Tax=Streptomyces hygroscopicus TaxID=1912 RepID=UPI0033D5BC85
MIRTAGRWCLRAYRVVGIVANRRVGDRVRDLREQRALSQERLAELTGLSRHTIYRIELAQYGTSSDQLALIARALRVEIGSLFS